MLALLTTARKALVAGAVGFFSPLYVILQTGQDLTGRSIAACAVAGVLGGLATYEAPNTEQYGPLGQHHPTD